MSVVCEAVVAVRRFAARVGAVLICLTGFGLTSAPAVAAPGFGMQVSGLPDQFIAGGGIATVAAVVSKQTDGCLKVRWSMVLRVEGLRLDQLKVDRIEETGQFPLDIKTQGDVARLTDLQFDPGTLCPGRTVTARYRVAIDASVTDGRVTFIPEAYDESGRLLSRRTVAREVVRERAPAAPTTQAAEPTPAEPEQTPATDEVPATDEPSLPPTSGPAPGAAAGPTNPTSSSGGLGLVQIGFLLGGLLLFLGVGLLLRLRTLLRPAGAGADAGADVPPARGRGRGRLAGARGGGAAWARSRPDRGASSGW
jgi:hypothetical protein